ncbi:MAG: recombination mediator RecR [Pelagibacteraceae bacterium]|jgi:recombination protein RecR|uniref:recombination mediator RecR n=1 Tax=Candidatus Pelagibacter sp. HIMB109 TaxID=3415412 RepID=UPI0001BB4A20|nr:DNA replication and repair protein RecR [alpha proteobacterium HIMB114]MCI5053453.1 recombination mediator RecR [Pelagibacteraceae bacterium]MCI5079766.1 recombination mediator RecR [Pelagibacteraceae bacterium]|tara:strand:- start:137 stop:754 length:618 start_codon:yes stop_codon:yes gene_type:complete
MKFTEPVLDNLISLISRLPGLGPKSARRIALHLFKNKENLMKPLADTLGIAHEKILRCKICGAIKSVDANCTISKCEYIDNSYDQLCIVENIADMWAMEATNIYKGHYHILGGTLSALNGSDPESLLIGSLIDRVKKNNVKEVIIATSATIEGQTTAHYINDSLKNLNIKITKLAHGLPVGSEIEYLDDGTLFSAFKYRNSIGEK